MQTNKHGRLIMF